MKPTTPKVTLAQRARRYVLSLFVAFTFAAYAIHERQTGTFQALGSGDLAANGPVQAASLPSPSSPSNVVVVTVTPAPTTARSQAVSQPADQPVQPVQPAQPQAPTAVPVVASNGQYRDGEYVGPTVDAYYGLVQVKAVVQSGRLVDVQFLSYPSDRRTSQRINNFATPRLKAEAIQAQSAQVNIVSGATLTSEAFMQSLQSALSNALA